MAKHRTPDGKPSTSQSTTRTTPDTSTYQARHAAAETTATDLPARGADTTVDNWYGNIAGRGR